MEAIMPPTTVVPIEWQQLAPAPLASARGSTPKMNAKAVCRIGRSRRRGGFSGGLHHGVPFLTEGHRELDDENCILRHQAEEHQQPEREARATTKHVVSAGRELRMFEKRQFTPERMST